MCGSDGHSQGGGTGTELTEASEVSCCGREMISPSCRVSAGNAKGKTAGLRLAPCHMNGRRVPRGILPAGEGDGGELLVAGGNQWTDRFTLI